MKYLLFFMLAFQLTGCSFASHRYQPSEKEKLSNMVTKKVAIKLKKEKELYPCGTGGQMMHEIKMLALAFDYYKPLDIEEGRELLIVAVDEFMAAVNAEERIRPYLDNYPFVAKNIEIRIFIHKPDFSDFEVGKLCVISSLKGILKYKIHDPATKYLETIYQETYEEALQKLASAEKKSA